MEEVIPQPFKVIVDYAVTPDALENTYKSLKPDDGQLIGVFGSCGGGRDKWRRPILGEIAAKYCDKIIVTTEDPYDEDPLEIIDQIAQKIEDRAEKVLDRREAIKKALGYARPGDVVVVTGKGCEQSI